MIVSQTVNLNSESVDHDQYHIGLLTSSLVL